MIRAVARLRLLAKSATPPSSRASAMPRRRRAIVASMAGLATFAALHFGLMVAGEFFRTVRDPVYADKELRLTRLERSLPPDSPVVLVIGTSRTANGFAAGRCQEVLTESLGISVVTFNWGLHATGPVAHLLQLQRLLKDRHRPSLLVLEVHPPTLAQLPDGPLEGRLAEGTAMDWEELDAVANYGFPIDRLRSARQLALLNPWYGMRFQIMGRLAPSAIPYYLRYDAGRGTDANGWSPIQIPEVTEDVRALGRRQAKLEYEEMLASMRFGEQALRALRELLELCRKEAIPVLLLWMPEGSTFRGMYSSRVEADLERLFANLTQEYLCGFCNARTWMPDGAFIDGHHLLRESSGIFSERLAREAIEPYLRPLVLGRQ